MSRMQESGMPGFTIYWEDLETFTESLNNEELGRALRAVLCAYTDADTDEWPYMEGGDSLMFNLLRRKIDIQCEKYEETCERNREIARKREAAKAVR